MTKSSNPGIDARRHVIEPGASWSGELKA